MAVIVHQSNSWPSSKASDNAELKIANGGDSFGIEGIVLAHSALSITRHNGGYAELGIAAGSL